MLATASAAITASGIMAVMVVHATNAATNPFTPNDPRNLRLDQVTTVLWVMLIVLAAALLGIPGGIGIYDAVKNAGSPVIPAAGWVAVMVLGTVLAAAILTAIPARLGTRQPVAEILQAETA